MLRIEMDGICEGCKCADLELDYFGTASGKEWFINCTHRNACDRMETKTINKLRPTIEAEPNSCEYWDSESRFCALRRPQAEPIKHGRWIKNEDRSGWHCSCCGKDDVYAYLYTENNERELQDFYCPNCGAKMDEVE